MDDGRWGTDQVIVMVPTSTVSSPTTALLVRCPAAARANMVSTNPQIDSHVAYHRSWIPGVAANG